MPRSTDTTATPRRRKRATPSRDAGYHVAPRPKEYQSLLAVLNDVDSWIPERYPGDWLACNSRRTRFDPCAPRCEAPRDKPDDVCSNCKGEGIHREPFDAQHPDGVECWVCNGTGCAHPLDAADPATADDLARLADALPHDSMRWLLACCAASLALPYCDHHPAAVAAIETRRAWLRGEASVAMLVDAERAADVPALTTSRDTKEGLALRSASLVPATYGTAYDGNRGVHDSVRTAVRLACGCVPAARIWQRFRAVCAFVPTGGIE